jgi:hypothetical protein
MDGMDFMDNMDGERLNHLRSKALFRILSLSRGPRHPSRQGRN